MTGEHVPLWADQAFLRDVQYRDDANLAARQSIYAYAEPKRDLIGLVLASLELGGDETVADIGCGNGRYLAGLAERAPRAAAARGRLVARHARGRPAGGTPGRPGLRRRDRAAGASCGYPGQSRY